MLSKNYPNFNRSKKRIKPLKVIVCIQARMGSTRLRKKVLKKILGETLIEHIFRRLKACQEIDRIILATSLNKENDVLVKHAKEIGLEYYRGSEEDMISRLYETAKKFRADALVRITGDCPLVDPKVVDKIVKIYRKNYKKIDFLTNNFPPTFPHGLDAEILPLSTLERLNTEVKDSLHREWFTCYILENPKEFRIYNFKNPVDLSLSMRWTVDYPEDLVFVSKIYETLGKNNKIFTMTDILDFLNKNPQVSKINAKRIDKTIIGGIRSGAYHKLKKSL